MLAAGLRVNVSLYPFSGPHPVNPRGIFLLLGPPGHCFTSVKAGSIRPLQSLPAPSDELPGPWFHQQWAGLVAPNWSFPRAQNWFGSRVSWGRGSSQVPGLDREQVWALVLQFLFAVSTLCAPVSAARLSSPVLFVANPLPPTLLCSPGVPAVLWSSAGSTPSSPTSRPPTARCSTSAPSAPWRSSQPPAPTRMSTRSTLASAISSPSKCSL